MRKENPNPAPFSKGDPQLTGLAQKVDEADFLESLFEANKPKEEEKQEKVPAKRGSLKAEDDDYQFIKKLSSLRGVKQYDLISDMVHHYSETLTDMEKMVLKEFIK